jgi:broad specificity phosphatase PhoE
MRNLILIRHSLPTLDAKAPAAEWRLSPDGATRARQLARRLSSSATTIFTSREPKAAETASVIADVWGVGVQKIDGVHEHQRPAAQQLTREQFEGKIRELFARPSELVFGDETADAARGRFSLAIMRLIERTSHDVAVVTHGTVMGLFVASATGLDGFEFWRSQEMPCAVTLTIPELKLARMTLWKD